MTRPTAFAAALLAGAVLTATSCTKTPSPDSAWAAEIEGWRARRAASLTSPDGWLTLVGLYWLEPGTSRVGAAPDVEVFLEEEGVPPHAFTLELTPDQRILLDPLATSDLLVDGEPAAPRSLATDRSGTPSVLTLGALRMVVIQREDRFALRVRNPDSPVRTNFMGLEYFPLDARYRVEARLERYGAAKSVEVPVAQGPPQRMLAPGVVRFSLRGRQLSLQPLISSPNDTTYFFVFRDATSGRETYGAGRFLDAAAPLPGSDIVLLDFNRAYTPPCAFTPYATCPLPPPENVLPVPVRAGEKGYGWH